MTVKLTVTVNLLGDSVGKNSPAKQEIHRKCRLDLGHEDPLEKEMATHSNILAWRIPWILDLTGYSPLGHKRVRHDLVIQHYQKLIGRKDQAAGRSRGIPSYTPHG